VEVLQVGAGNELLSDVTACAEHADPYLADATDVVHLHPSTLPTSASGPVPALGDFVQVDGRAWEVWDVQTTEAGGHEVTLFAENLDDEYRWQAPGSLATVAWQPAPAPTGQDRDHLAAAHTLHPDPAQAGPQPDVPAADNLGHGQAQPDVTGVDTTDALGVDLTLDDPELSL
jgi:hypothetical protein